MKNFLKVLSLSALTTTFCMVVAYPVACLIGWRAPSLSDIHILMGRSGLLAAVWSAACVWVAACAYFTFFLRRMARDGK